MKCFKDGAAQQGLNRRLGQEATALPVFAFDDRLKVLPVEPIA
jgi:hypothetical protein